MYDLINQQFLSGKSLALPKFSYGIRKSMWPAYSNDLYPVNLDYYHELNPYFLCNLYQNEFYKFTDVITVRDGIVTFTDFLLKNSTNLDELGTKLFIIHPDFAPLVPQNIRHYFATRRIVQKKQTTLEEASKVIIFGLFCENNLGSLKLLEKRLQVLKNINPSAKIDICLPLRRNMFEKADKESTYTHEVMRMLNEVLKDKEFSFLSTEQFFESSYDKDTYLFDLAWKNFVTSDNFIHSLIQSRGGSVNNSSLTAPPKDSIFSFDLGLYHEFHVTPLPETPSVFMEVLMYKKQNPWVKDLTFDTNFHNLLRDLFPHS